MMSRSEIYHSLGREEQIAQLDELMSRKYEISLKYFKDEIFEGWSASIPELNEPNSNKFGSFFADGKTQAEALESLEALKEELFIDLIIDKVDVPPPGNKKHIVIEYYKLLNKAKEVMQTVVKDYYGKDVYNLDICNEFSFDIDDLDADYIHLTYAFGYCEDPSYIDETLGVKNLTHLTIRELADNIIHEYEEREESREGMLR